jgi:hypothetical protein
MQGSMQRSPVSRHLGQYPSRLVGIVTLRPYSLAATWGRIPPCGDHNRYNTEKAREDFRPWTPRDRRIRFAVLRLRIGKRADGQLRWPRLSEQNFRVDKWSVHRG